MDFLSREGCKEGVEKWKWQPIYVILWSIKGYQQQKKYRSQYPQLSVYIGFCLPSAICEEKKGLREKCKGVKLKWLIFVACVNENLLLLIGCPISDETPYHQASGCKRCHYLWSTLMLAGGKSSFLPL